jgi:hypothetical protein
MKLVYVALSVNPKYGTFPESAGFFSSMDENFILNSENILYKSVLATNFLQHQIIERFVKLAEIETQKKPDSSNGMYGFDLEKKPIYKKSPVKINYDAMGPWPKKRESEKHGELRANKSNKAMKNGLMKAYKELVFFLGAEN